MTGAALVRAVRKFKPIKIETRVCWQHIGHPEAGFLLFLSNEHGLKAGDKVRVTIERIEK